MDIIIRNTASTPIYEQIATQIQQQIMNGSLQEGEMLPSMRMLAKELRISVITTKRAYEELEAAGFIVTVMGKGSFVAKRNIALLQEQQRRMVEEQLQKAVELAQISGITLEEVLTMTKILYGGDIYEG